MCSFISLYLHTNERESEWESGSLSAIESHEGESVCYLRLNDCSMTNHESASKIIKQQGSKTTKRNIYSHTQEKTRCLGGAWVEELIFLSFPCLLGTEGGS